MFPTLAGIALTALMLAAADNAAADAPTVDLGDIPQRRPPPTFRYQRFAQMRELAQVQFSADDRLIYFVDNDGRVNNLFALDPATGHTRQLTHFDDPVSRFEVDHAGRFVVIVKDHLGNEHYDLYRFDLTSGAVTRLTETNAGDTSMLCGVSPDDRHVYFAQTRDHRREAALWEVDSDGGTPRLLVESRGRTLECDQLSPDGRYLVYGELIGFDTRHLALLDLTSDQTHSILAVSGINNLDGAVAGDDVFFRSALGADGFRLWRYHIGDARPVPIDLPGVKDIDALALYSGGRVGVIRYRDGLSDRTAVFVDGFRRQLGFDLPADAVVGAVFSHHDPGLGVVSIEAATLPRRYYLVGAGAPLLIHDSNRSGIRPDQLAEVRSLLIASFDGLPIPVHLFIPNGTSPCHRRPVIVLIHGGPEEHVDPVYLSDVQFLANRGFIVVVPNVRGSTGFGVRYAALDDADWGGAHVRDTVAVAGAVRALDFVDDGNLFVAGNSFGGFSVMSLITQYPDTFRAAVDMFGFTELATLVDSWPRFMQRNQASALGFDPRVDVGRNRERSPIYHVERIRIPLQVHQGANDGRVPRNQSDWLVQRLRRLGREVEYFVYPDEGHGFTRLANEARAYERMVAFFRRNLRRSQRIETSADPEPGDATTSVINPAAF